MIHYWATMFRDYRLQGDIYIVTGDCVQGPEVDAGQLYSLVWICIKCSSSSAERRRKAADSR